ncbi:MAG: hypothetical protein ABI045_00385 [Flavobacteriales bacterium]
MKKFINKYLKIDISFMITAGMIFCFSSTFSQQEIDKVWILIRQLDLH